MGLKTGSETSLLTGLAQCERHYVTVSEECPLNTCVYVCVFVCVCVCVCAEKGELY